MTAQPDDPRLNRSVEAAQAGRSLTDRIRDPSPAGLFVAVLISIVPLAWPLLLYMALRYATGHRAPRVDGEQHRLLAMASRTAGRPAKIDARWVAALASLATGAGETIYQNWPFWTTFVYVSGVETPRRFSQCQPGLQAGATCEWWPFAMPGLSLQFIIEGAIVAVVTFLAIAALRWAWRSFR